jgi:hypothetical protein
MRLVGQMPARRDIRQAGQMQVPGVTRQDGQL